MADAPGNASGAAAGGAPPEGRAYAHPVAAFFLFFFKAAAVVFYIFCGWFPTDFVINFCVITFLLVCDFWTVGMGRASSWIAVWVGAWLEGSCGHCLQVQLG